jgi:putative membrane protein
VSRGGRSLKQAFLAGPGPESWGQALVIWLKGMAMGTADIIPGVSGGTIAFITNIYRQLLAAISSFDLEFVKRLARLDLAGALERVHLSFLLPLLVGIGVAVVSVARVVHYLLEHHPVQVWALFFGLIAASIWVVGRQVRRWGAGSLAALAGGTAAGWLIVGLIPVQTPQALWFVFLSGMISLIAMILPGISGAFILLILGKYAYITGAMRDPWILQNLLVIAVFLAGGAVGLAGFSRVLNWLFEARHDLTVAALTGFMLGAMRKIWPWKEVAETRMVAGKEMVLRETNVLPPAYDDAFWLAVALAAAGFAAVVLLETLSRRQAGAERPS